MEYNQVEASINFRTVKSKDAEGNALETKRDSIKIHIPVPSAQDIIDIIQAGQAEGASLVAVNNLQLLNDALFNTVFDIAAGLAKDNTSLTSANFPMDELDWEKIANAPEAERKSRGITKEEWADFAEDYITSMPGITGKDESRVQRAAAVLIEKFMPIKSDKKSIAVVRDSLAVYAEQAPNAVNNLKVIEFLLKKADALLAAEVLGESDF